MKKIYIVILLVIAIIGIVVGSVLLYTGSNPTSNVTFNIKQDDARVTVYEILENNTENSKQVDSFTVTSSLDLPKGDYYYIVEGEHINSSSFSFKIPGTSTIDVNPQFDSTYLATLLDSEQPTIQQIIENTYPKITNSYIIHPGKFYEQGQWYATIITDKRSSNDNIFANYRIVFHKENGAWTAVTTPEISLSKITFDTVPRDILSDINNSTPESLEEWSHTGSLDDH